MARHRVKNGVRFRERPNTNAASNRTSLVLTQQMYSEELCISKFMIEIDLIHIKKGHSRAGMTFYFIH
jgi:hypothetical protein